MTASEDARKKVWNVTVSLNARLHIEERVQAATLEEAKAEAASVARHVIADKLWRIEERQYFGAGELGAFAISQLDESEPDNASVNVWRRERQEEADFVLDPSRPRPSECVKLVEALANITDEELADDPRDAGKVLQLLLPFARDARRLCGIK